MAKSNTVSPKINLDSFCRDFLSTKTFHNFEMLTEESYKKIEEVENNLNKKLDYIMKKKLKKKIKL